MKTLSDIKVMMLETPKEVLSIYGNMASFSERYETDRYNRHIITSKKLEDFEDEINNPKPAPVVKGFMHIPDDTKQRSVCSVRYDKLTDVMAVLAYEHVYGKTRKSKTEIYRNDIKNGLTISHKGYTKLRFKKRVLKKNGTGYINRQFVNYLSLKNWHHLPVTQDLRPIFMYHMIGKRWLLDEAFLRDSGTRHIPISNKESRKCDTLKDVAQCITGHNVSYRLIDNIGIPETYMMYRMVDGKDIPKVASFIYKDNTAFDTSFDTIEAYITSTVGVDTIRDQYIIADYLRQALSLGEKVNLKASSFRRYQEEHDRQAVAIRLHHTPDIKTTKKYRTLFGDCDHKVELIDSKEDLCKEGAMMHHCVASYAHSINAGQCSIWKTEWDNEPYTIEVGLDSSGYRLGQVKGVCNASAPPDLRRLLMNHLLKKDSSGEERIISKEELEYETLPF